MTIQIRRSSVSGVVPVASGLLVGELAVNTADGMLWTKHTNGSLVLLNSSGYLPIIGGSMNGSIDMNENQITNADTISASEFNGSLINVNDIYANTSMYIDSVPVATTDYVDAEVANLSATVTTGYIPYTGASSHVNLNSKNLTAGSGFFGGQTTDGSTGAKLSVSYGIYTPGFVWASSGITLASNNVIDASTVNSSAGVRLTSGQLQLVTGGPVLKNIGASGINVLRSDGILKGDILAGSITASDITVSGNIMPVVHNLSDLGSSAIRFKTGFFAAGITAAGQSNFGTVNTANAVVTGSMTMGHATSSGNISVSGDIILATLNSSRLIFGSTGNTKLSATAGGLLLYDSPNGAGSASHYFRENGISYLQIAGGALEVQGTRSYTFSSAGASAGDISIYRVSATQLEINNRTLNNLRDLRLRDLSVDNTITTPSGSLVLNPAAYVRLPSGKGLYSDNGTAFNYHTGKVGAIGGFEVGGSLDNANHLIKNNGGILAFRNGTDTADTSISCSNITSSGNISVSGIVAAGVGSAGNVSFQIGSASTGFYSNTTGQVRLVTAGGVGHGWATGYYETTAIGLCTSSPGAGGSDIWLNRQSANTAGIGTTSTNSLGNLSLGQLTTRRSTAASYGVYAQGINASGYVDWELNEGLTGGNSGGTLTLRAGDLSNTGFLRFRYDQGYPKIATNQSSLTIQTGSSGGTIYASTYISQTIGGNNYYVAQSDGTVANRFLSYSTTQATLVSRGMTGQTGNLIEGQTVSSGVVFSVGPAGAVLADSITVNPASTSIFRRSSFFNIRNTAAGVLHFRNWAETGGIGFNLNTANTLILRNIADNAEGNLSAGGIVASSGIISSGTVTALGGLLLQNSTVGCTITPHGSNILFKSNDAFPAKFIGDTEFRQGSNMGLSWTNGTSFGGTKTTTLSQASSGILQIGNVGNNALGTLRLKNLKASEAVDADFVTVSGYYQTNSIARLGVSSKGTEEEYPFLIYNSPPVSGFWPNAYMCMNPEEGFNATIGPNIISVTSSSFGLTSSLSAIDIAANGGIIVKDQNNDLYQPVTCSGIKLYDFQQEVLATLNAVDTELKFNGVSVAMLSGGNSWTGSQAINGVVTSKYEEVSGSGNPTTSNLSSTYLKAIKNTTIGEVRLWSNDGGVMKSAVLTKPSEDVATPTGTTQTISLNEESKHRTLDLTSSTGTVTLTLNVPQYAGTAGTLLIKQHATTARNIIWAVNTGSIKWLGTQPTWNTDATSSYRVVSWRYNGSFLFLSSTEAGT
jgi:hypothetical protein